MIIFSLPAKVPLFLVKNKQTRFFLLISSFYSNIYCIFALTNALVAKLVDALDLGSSGSGRRKLPLGSAALLSLVSRSAHCSQQVCRAY